MCRILQRKISTDAIKKSFELTTQFNKTSTYIIPKENFDYFFPTFNKKYQDKQLFTNTIFSILVAIDNRYLVHVSMKVYTLVTNFCRIDTNRKFISTLNHNIRKQGVIDRIFLFILLKKDTLIIKLIIFLQKIPNYYKTTSNGILKLHSTRVKGYF